MARLDETAKMAAQATVAKIYKNAILGKLTKIVEVVQMARMV